MVSRLVARAGLVAIAIVGTTTPVALADGSGSSLVAVCGERPTIVGTPGDDVITGTSKADVIYAKGGNDIVRGGGGHDMICLGGGDDQAFGSGGDDLIVGSAGRDSVDAGGGNDFVFGAGGADEIRSTSGFDGVLAGPGADHVVLRSVPGAFVDAGGGDDAVAVDTAPDAQLSLVGGAGTDELWLSVSGVDGTARLNQRTGSVELGSRGDFDGWEIAHLNGQTDWIYLGSDGGESLLVDGGTLTAFMHGGDDNVTVTGDGDAYVDLGDGGLQSAQTGAGDDTLVGGPGLDRLESGAGDDILNGGEGLDDELAGGDGTDVGKDPDGASYCIVEVQLGACVDAP